MKDTYPLWVVPGVRRGKSMVFLGYDEEIVVDTYTEELEELLYLCNGRNTRTDVIRHLPHGRSEIFGALLDDLLDLEIVLDSRRAYQYFHRLTENPQRFSSNLSAEEVLQHLGSPRTALPEGEVVSLPPAPILNNRQPTCRNFTNKGIDRDSIIEILYRSAGGMHGPAPSAGGLYPLQTFMIIRHCEGFMPGYYAYDGPSNRLVRLAGEQLDDELVAYGLDSETILGEAPVVLVLAADLERQPAKYANRGYRFTMIEAGHCAQNIQLVASEMGLGVFEYGGFSDKKLQALFSMPTTVMPLLVLGIGVPMHGQTTGSSQEALDGLIPQYVGKNKIVNRLTEVLVSGRDGEEFYTASSHYRPVKGQDAKETFGQRYASGVGRSHSEARLKALVEGVERYKSGCVRIDLVGAVQDLGMNYFDPRRAAPLRAEQLRLAAYSEFSPEATYEWCAGRDAYTHESVAALVDHVYYPVYESLIGRPLCYSANSSGVAAHTSHGEAVSRGVLELVERDALMRLWLYREPPRKVAESALPTHIQRRAKWWNQHGYEMSVFDISQFGVAVVSVFLHRDEYPAQSSGAAASFESFESAALKALTEAEHGLIMALRDNKQGLRLTERLSPEDVVSPIDHAHYYYEVDNARSMSWAYEGEEETVPAVPFATFEDLVESIRPIVFTLTTPIEPIQVCRVLCEQLVPINFGFASEHDVHPSLDQNRVAGARNHPHFFA